MYVPRRRQRERFSKMPRPNKFRPRSRQIIRSRPRFRPNIKIYSPYHFHLIFLLQNLDPDQDLDQNQDVAQDVDQNLDVDQE